MRRLTKIYGGLGRLRLLRTAVRLGSAWSIVLSILLWALAGAFALDFWIRMGRLERGIVLIAAVALVAWAVAKHLLPAMKIRESDTALAVLVDQRQGMHSDLVAAIQFEDVSREQYGSGDLREAVIDYTDAASGDLDLLEGFTPEARKQIMSRLAIFLLTAAVCLVPGAIWRSHTAAFLNRLLLGQARYPTRTIIKEIVSPGRSTAYGRPVKFAVRADGELPKTGKVKVEAVSKGMDATVELHQDPDDPRLYVGTLADVYDDMSYTVFIGDDHMGPRKLELIPLPLVQLKMVVEAPLYARHGRSGAGGNRQQVVVLEGSKVIPVVTADKELASVKLDILEKVETDEPSPTGKPVMKVQQTITMTRRGKAFVVDSDGPTAPFARVTKEIRFRIRARDTDGLPPERPIEGLVAVANDNAPSSVALFAFSRLVVPKARPQLSFGAEDDYALARLELHLSVRRADEVTDLDPVVVKLKEHPPGYRGVYPLNLAALKVSEGDEVAVVVEAFDYRGPAPAEGKSRRSQKWVFKVTDRAGVLRGMDRLQEQMGRKLDEAVRAQFEAGN